MAVMDAGHGVIEVRQMACARVKDGGGFVIGAARVRDGDGAELRGLCSEVNCAGQLCGDIRNADESFGDIV